MGNDEFTSKYADVFYGLSNVLQTLQEQPATINPM